MSPFVKHTLSKCLAQAVVVVAQSIVLEAVLEIEQLTVRTVSVPGLAHLSNPLCLRPKSKPEQGQVDGVMVTLNAPEDIGSSYWCELEWQRNYRCFQDLALHEAQAALVFELFIVMKASQRSQTRRC